MRGEAAKVAQALLPSARNARYMVAMGPRVEIADDELRTRARLLERAVEHVLERGLADASLRAIALEIDTSHRMLIYHFGSAEEFWDALLERIRVNDQRSLARMLERGQAPTLEQVWAHFSSPRHLPLVRVVFQVYGKALQDPTRFERFLSSVVDGVLNHATAGLQKQLGFTRTQARREARIGLALIRGLLLDLLTTGDRKGTTAALHEFARRARSRARAQGRSGARSRPRTRKKTS